MTGLLIVGLFMTHMSLNVLSNAGLKLSASGGGVKGYVSWQLVGNVAGFLGIQALPGLMALLPMHIAFPVSQGLAVIGTQVLAAHWFFKETITPLQWAGTVLVVAGIALIGSGR